MCWRLLIGQVDQTMFRAETETEGASEKSTKWDWHGGKKKNTWKMSMELCDVCGKTVFSCVIMQIAQN